MGMNRREKRGRENPNDYERMSYQAHILTRQQGEEFERRQAEPPRQPTEEERDLVRMFHRTVKR
jgi:hypothetical protein